MSVGMEPEHGSTLGPPGPTVPIVAYTLAGTYGLVFLVSSIQLFRIQRRAGWMGWTTQKLFHLLTIFSTLIRAAYFGTYPVLRHDDRSEPNKVLMMLFAELPTSIFFSTYSLLVLFWAEIYHYATNQSLTIPQRLRPIFVGVNVAVYTIQIAFWVILGVTPTSDDRALETGLDICFAAICLVCALGFLVYGGRLYMMLKRFPIESKGRRNRLREVGSVTVICCVCFSVRSGFLLDGAAVHRAQTWVFWVCYYVVAEIIPSSLVLFILRKIPPRRDERASSLLRAPNTQTVPRGGSTPQADLIPKMYSTQ